MNNKALTISLLMAVLAVFFVQEYVSSIEESARKKFGTQVLVLKAKKAVKEMETLNESHIAFKRIPKNYVEPGAISFEKEGEDEETIKSLKSLVGSIAIVPIKEGEQITFNKITDPGMRTGLSPQVTPGKRAISVPVSEISGVGKLVKPGDRVDVIAVIDTGGGKETKITKTVLQDVVVLATGRNVSNNVARTVETDSYTGRERVKNLNEDPNFATATLEVEPGQAQAIMLLLNIGENSLYLSLRNNDDNERTVMSATNVLDVLGPDLQRIPAPRAPAGRK